MFFSTPVFTSGLPPEPLLPAITRAKLLTNLKICLDAGETASYPGTGQVWNDRSGNGHNFNRGVGSGAAADDPTFNGVAGRRSPADYWSFDGGDWFSLVGTNPAWANTIHKRGAKFAMCGWFYFTSTATKVIFTTRRATGDHGFSLSGGNDLRFYASAAGGVNIIEMDSVDQGVLFPLNQWCFVAVNVEEAGPTNSSFLMINDQIARYTKSYSASSTSNASYTLRIGGNGGTVYLASGSRMINLACWDANLTEKDMLSIYKSTKQVYTP